MPFSVIRIPARLLREGLLVVLLCCVLPPAFAQKGKKKATTHQPVKKASSVKQKGASKKEANSKKEVKKKEAPAQKKEPAKPQPRRTATRRRTSDEDELSTRQSRAQLEAEKRRNQERISEINQVLDKTTTEKKASLTELKALNSKIETKSRQIELLSEDLDLLNVEMKELNVVTGKLTKDLQNLKKEYASMIYAASKTTNTYSKLSFLFSANSFNSLVMRYQYLRQYTEAREMQVRHIEEVRGQLVSKQQTIKYKQYRKKEVLTAQVTENKNLENVKVRQAAVVNELSKQETDLKSELAERTKAINRLDNMITRIIEREIRRATLEREERARKERLARQQAEEREAARARAAEAASRVTSEKAKPDEPTAVEKAAAASENTGNEAVVRSSESTRSRAAIAAAPEAEAGASFGSSRGRLPWPVRSGYISEHFGLNSPMPGITTRNLGVDIATNPGEPVRAVYDGIVRGVSSMTGVGTVVIIQHGEYFTIYAKLASAAVSEGQRIKAREPIGTAMADKDGGAEINFQVWKGNGKLNPESWLAGK